MNIDIKWFIYHNEHKRRRMTQTTRETATVPTTECLRDTEEFGVTSVVVEIALNICVSLGDTDDFKW